MKGGGGEMVRERGVYRVHERVHSTREREGGGRGCILCKNDCMKETQREGG